MNNARQSVGNARKAQLTQPEGEPFVFEWYDNQLDEALAELHKADVSQRAAITEAVNSIRDSSMFIKLEIAYDMAQKAAEGHHRAPPATRKDHTMHIPTRNPLFQVATRKQLTYAFDRAAELLPALDGVDSRKEMLTHLQTLRSEMGQRANIASTPAARNAAQRQHAFMCERIRNLIPLVNPANPLNITAAQLAHTPNVCCGGRRGLRTPRPL